MLIVTNTKLLDMLFSEDQSQREKAMYIIQKRYKSQSGFDGFYQMYLKEKEKGHTKVDVFDFFDKLMRK